MRSSPRNLRNAAAGMLLAVALALGDTAAARATPEALPEMAVAALPQQGRAVLERIRAGGPFGHERDGVVFGNRERILPPKSRGYYHEYTVRTPGTGGRGARRIVCGGPATAPVVCYYSDHYRSFARIRE